MPDPTLIQTAATTAMASTPTAIMANGAEWTMALTGVPIVGWWIVRMVRRILSKDKVEIVKDRAEIDVLKTLQDEATKLRSDNDRIKDRLEVVSKERNDAVSQLGRFAAETELSRVKIGELQTAITVMTSKLEEQSKLLRDVLAENAYLKSRVDNLSELNSRLEREVNSLEDVVGKINAKFN